MNFRSHPLTRLDHYLPSRLFLLLMVGGLLTLLSLQLANLSIRKAPEYQEQARNNLFARKRLSAPRGNIYDRNGVVLATNRRTYSVSFTIYGLKEADARASLGKVREVLGVPSLLDEEAIIAKRPTWTIHQLVRYAEQADIIALLERPNEFPGVRIEDDFKRDYTHPTDFALILGHVGKIQEGETDIYSRPRYLPDDEVGRSGLERALQDELAGHPGYERYRRNARGRYIDEPDILEETRAGKNLHLTLDQKLQTRAMELLNGVTGTILLMDVRTGEVLVMASTPTYDPKRPGATEIDGRPAGYINRAIRGQFAPGSTFKIVGAAAAMQAGIHNDHHHCNGRFHIAGWDRPFWCNVRTGHGPTTVVQSLQWSCNSWYYDLGPKLGAEPLLAMTRSFGYGESTGVDLPGERSGNTPTPEQLSAGELTNFTIGQGRLLATPLQVARSFAAIANGGYLPTPKVVMSIGTQPVALEAAPGKRVGLSSSQIEAITTGMYRVVNEPTGTAYKAAIPRDWDVVGKTGTAENPTGGVDAWFAGFFPRTAPQYAFVVHIESADGHGGTIAGPIGKAIIGATLGKEVTLDLAAAELQ